MPDRILDIDLTGSNAGPDYRSVELRVAPPDHWSEERLCMEAASYYAVPLDQVVLRPRREVRDA